MPAEPAAPLPATEQPPPLAFTLSFVFIEAIPLDGVVLVLFGLLEPEPGADFVAPLPLVPPVPPPIGTPRAGGLGLAAPVLFMPLLSSALEGDGPR